MLKFETLKQALYYKTHCPLCNSKLDNFNFELQPYKKTDEIKIHNLSDKDIQFSYISSKFHPYYISYDLSLDDSRFDFEVLKKENELKDYSRRLSAINSSVINRSFFIEINCDSKICSKFLEPTKEYSYWIDVKLDLKTETISSITLDGEYFMILFDDKIYEITLGHPAWIDDKEYCVASVINNLHKDDPGFNSKSEFIPYNIITSNNVFSKGKEQIVNRVNKIILLK